MSAVGWRHAASWFPGHMARASRQIREQLPNIDLVLEVRDARVPFTSAPAHLDEILRRTGRLDRRFTVLNKADLVGDVELRAAASALGAGTFVTQTRMLDGARGAGIRDMLTAALSYLQLCAPRLFARAPVSGAPADAPGRPGDGRGLPLLMMAVGVPNTGKSSLINALRHVCRRDGHGDPRRKRRSARPAKTGTRPGVTRQQGGFQVSWAPHVWLLDTPGVLPPKLDGDWLAALRLGASDILPAEHCGLDALASFILHHLAATRALGDGALAGYSRLRAAAAARLAGTSAAALSGAPLHAGATDEQIAAAEALGLALLEALADDIGGGEGQSSLNGASERVLRLMREGQLGEIFWDADRLPEQGA